MAQIDIKYATVNFIDGDIRTGKVTTAIPSVSTPTFSASITMDSALRTDGTAVTALAGRTFQIGSDPTVYTFASGTTALGITAVTVTFTPQLAQPVALNAVVTVNPAMLSLNNGEGTITYDEKVTRQYMRNRGRLDLVRNGDEEPIDVKFDVVWEFITAVVGAGLLPSAEDFLKQRGNASTLVTATADECQPFSINIQIIYTPNCAGTEKEIITLPEFRYEAINHDLKAGTLAMTGKCNATQAIVARQ